MGFHKLSYVAPLKLYAILRELDMPFILHSAEKHAKKAQFTYLSAMPKFLLTVRDSGTYLDNSLVSRERNPFRAIKNIGGKYLTTSTGSETFRLTSGFVGYFAYDAVHNYIGGEINEASVFGYYPWMFIYNHLRGELYFYSDEIPPFSPERIVEKSRKTELHPVKGNSHIIGVDAEPEEFENIVARGKEYIFAGDVFQVVLSREYRIKSDLTPFDIYRKLLSINPSPYTFLLEFEKCMVGTSPETMGSVRGSKFTINPIAGTTHRGTTKMEDDTLAGALLNDEKERAEHMMLVDLARNDVGRVSRPGSVKLPRFFDIVKYSHVQHIESEVTGILREGCDMIDAIESSFPAGTVTGAPKIRAMEIIDELEKSRRRVYGGGIGYFSSTGNSDFAIGIRMAEIDRVIRVRAGAGIVADSVPHREYIETERKMGAMLQALDVVT